MERTITFTQKLHFHLYVNNLKHRVEIEIPIEMLATLEDGDLLSIKQDGAEARVDIVPVGHNYPVGVMQPMDLNITLHSPNETIETETMIERDENRLIRSTTKTSKKVRA